jgi:hypothetical protein
MGRSVSRIAARLSRFLAFNLATQQNGARVQTAAGRESFWFAVCPLSTRREHARPNVRDHLMSKNDCQLPFKEHR